MNRQQAVQWLHDRHPQVIGAPGDLVDLGLLHLEVYWFQGYVCDLMEQRSGRSLQRCFATIERLLIEGERDVLIAICDHFFVPHMVFQPELTWAKQWMPPLLASLCSRVEQGIPKGPIAEAPDDRSGGGG
jgi:hypothetical protein